MECNRDEALRAKEIAERKFVAKDIGGAKKFALKAKNLFPVLEGINQMIATLDVYLSSGAQHNGEKDWYAVLSVNPSADEETLKRQYRKLALQLHPDKNKSIGAEGAFQLISEAWSVLSDRSKRIFYDQKRGGKGVPPKPAPPPKKDSFVPNNSNGFHTFANNAASKGSAPKNNTSMPPPSSGPSRPSSVPLKSETFWTTCTRCKMQYEYLRVYLDHNLLCPNCKEPFLATENKVPMNGPNFPPPQVPAQVHQHSSNNNSATKNGNGASTLPSTGSSGLQHGNGASALPAFQWGPFSRTAGAASATSSSTAAAQAANIVQQTYEKVKREREEAQAAVRREEGLRRKSQGLKRTASGSGNLGAGLDGNIQSSLKVDKQAKRRRGIGDDAGTSFGGEDTLNSGLSSGNPFTPGVMSRKFHIRRGVSQGDLRTVLMERSKSEVHQKVEEWHSAEEAKKAEKENAKKKQKQQESVKEKVKEIVPGNTDEDRMDESKPISKPTPAKKDLPDTLDANSDKEVIEPVSIDVPDPDFHDFDKDRTERTFQGDQIWAIYDDEDGMPRYYVLIQKVISYKPFKVRLSFLSSRSNSEFGPLNWVASGFAKTSGEFRVGRYEVKDTLNIFSHKVRWEKGPRGIIKIIPRKGEIWALYRNWSPDWDEHTPDTVMYKYDMVEVLEEYKEEEGVPVAPLVKVAGFKTVFHRHMDPEEIKTIPRAEIFRFSHQVPSYVLTGEEGNNAPKGCLELDPAATPLELLQVVTKTMDDEVMKVVEPLQKEQAVS